MRQYSLNILKPCHCCVRTYFDVSLVALVKLNQHDGVRCEDSDDLQDSNEVIIEIHYYSCAV